MDTRVSSLVSVEEEHTEPLCDDESSDCVGERSREPSRRIIEEMEPAFAEQMEVRGDVPRGVVLVEE